MVSVIVGRPLIVCSGAMALAALAPAPASAKGCPPRDARAMLAATGVGINGRVLASAEEHIDVLAESSYAPDAVGFGERVRIRGKSLPATRNGRIGIVLHRDAKGFTADFCDVIPASRMARAIRGVNPCPRPTVRVHKVVVDGRSARMTLAFTGDTTSLRIDSGVRIRRIPIGPGVRSMTVTNTFPKAGTYRVATRVGGGGGPGCRPGFTRTATAGTTIVIA